MDALGYETAVHAPSWSFRVDTWFSDCTDLCSTFSRYIAPLYRHDRVDRSVQMRLYTLNKRHFALIFILVFIGLAVTVVIGFVGPPILEHSQINSSALVPPPADRLTGDFVIKSPPLSTFNQQLWLTARVLLSDHSGTFEQPLHISVLIRSLVDGSTGSVVFNSREHNHSRSLHCADVCESIIVLHLGYLVYPAYIATVRIQGLQAVVHPIKDIEFTYTYYKSSFTQLEIWLRFTFLLMTFIITCVFAHSLRKFSLHDWSIEQKWMTWLLPLLLLFDNPVFPLTFLVNSSVPSIVDVVFQVTFLCAILLYWLCIYHGVRQTKRTFAVFYLPKLFFVALVWLAVVTALSWQSYQQLNDPTYNYALDSSNYLGYKIFVGVVLGLYLLYLVYLLVRACTELRAMPYFDLRLKFMTVLMVLVLGLGLVIAFLRFGWSPFGDGFTAELSPTRFHNCAEFAALYGLLNLYVFTMAFVYSPSKNAVYESHFKDNPALSMLNDSDEEVVYGEETSLTRIKTPGVKYDSDEEAFN